MVSFTIVAAAATWFLAAGDAPELGRVEWRRDLDAARQESAKSGRPVLVLFQEVPGCSTCVGFGQGVLSLPLVVEAMEEAFIPVLVYNNRQGKDADLLSRFGEPAWNNPVIRYLDAKGEDVIARRDRVWSLSGTATRMVEALEAAKREVPPYLRSIARETDASRHRSATFAMHCFWEGEARLGNLDGVVTTRAAWLDGREVVDVTYDPSVVDVKQLVAAADRLACADRVYVPAAQLDAARGVTGERAHELDGMPTDAKETDRKFALRRAPHRYLPLTPAQASKVNAALRLGGDVDTWLSPRQRALLARIEARLAKDANALSALNPPRTLDDLPAYEAKLREALDS